MGALLGSGSSDARIRSVETAFDLPVDARGRGRSDFGCIFMLAPDPPTARAWRPLLVFHMSGESPVYATSSINDGVLNSRNSDLNGVLFVEVPAMLPPRISDRLSRLRALGQDALSLAQHWNQATITNDWIIRGHTGTLRRKQNGMIERASELATFDDAEVRYGALP
jgi:outer membrane PBP1 activator LpoA protein